MIIPQTNSTTAGSSPVPMYPLPGTQFFPNLPALDSTLGALLIGTFVGLMQYGWTANQCYRYYRTYPEDRWLLKGMVMAVLLLETIHSVLCTHICYYYLVTNYLKPQALTISVWSLKLLGVTSGLVVPVSQSFFLLRVYTLGSRFRPLVVFVSLLLLGEFGIATADSISLFLSPQTINSQAWMDSTGVGLAALADTIITAALIYSLHHSRTGFKSTDTLIDTLIVYFINTGLLTDFANLACFVCAIAMPDNLVYAGLTIVGCKLYANTVLTVLNSRSSWASGRNPVTMSSYSTSIPVQSSSTGVAEDAPDLVPNLSCNPLPMIRVSTVVTSVPDFALDGLRDLSKM